MKRLFSIVLSLVFTFSFTSTSFAAETNSYAIPTDTDNYMSYNLPNDAVVLYQSEDGIIYQSSVEDYQPSTQSMNYNGVWIDKDKMKLGSFSIVNPHTIVNKTNGTFKIESNDPNVSAEMILYGSGTLLADKIIKPADGDVHFSFKSNVKNLTVQYSVVKKSRTAGMRLNCWLW